ncbi:O-antigen ligase [Novosphingobium sp.]|uniref:O-antigen ligase family protein n=1 Tax=Novosphingobium sp. TaxID=1874826 RepID=UPI002734272B|nr:O-antigen ligase family protein [Novosphingobium sp.]MDP3906632.1 O-antigen ligase family protein [Novosphingobium sp.]
MLAVGFVFSMLVLGGGGTPAPLSELLCQLLAAVTLFGWLALRGADSLPVGRKVWLVLGLIAAIPLLQLIPLPPAVWQALPGRESLREALALVGQDTAWRPWTVAPQRTLDAVLSLLPPFVVVLVVATLGARDRQLLLRVIAGFGLLSVAVGAGQLAGGGEGPLQFYSSGEPGVLFGFQANRNAQVDVLLIAILALLAGWSAAAAKSRAALGALVIISFVLVLGAVLTGSRAGIALVPVTLAWGLYLLRRERVISALRVKVWQWLALGGALAVAAFAAWQTNAIAKVLARFDFTGEYRPDIWRDTMFAIGQYWPVGSGVGTFTRVISPAERLEAVGGTLPNRAHNEYLELLLEGGIPLSICWAIAAGIVLLGVWTALRSPHKLPIGQAVFAAGTISLTATHSLVDYPFRSMALVSLIAVAAAMVLAPRLAEQPTRPRESTNL